MPPITPATKPIYDWDRTIEEDARRQEQIRISKTAFPTPNSATVSFEKFCEYYNDIRETPVGRYAKIFVARWWPVLLPVEKMDRFGNFKEGFPTDVKIVNEDGPLSQQLMLQVAGVGSYKFRLNDSRRPWGSQTVLFTELEISDRQLWELHPPVFELERLDYENNRNQAYIKYARSRGILPREDELNKEQSDMASAGVVDKVLDDAREKERRADQIQRDELERSRRELAEAKEALAQANANKATATPAAPSSTSDLQGMGNVLVSLVTAIRPQPDGSLSEYLKLEAAREVTRREQEREERKRAQDAATAERTRADNLQQEILNSAKAAQAAPTAVAAAPLTLLQQFQEVETFISTAKRISRGGAQAEEEAKPGNLDKWADILPLIAQPVGQVIQGLFQTIQYGFTAWQTNSYNNALRATGAQPQPPASMTPDSKPPEPGRPIAPQAPAPTAEQSEQQKQWNAVMGGIVSIAPHLTRHLDKGKTGEDFAEFIIENAPEERTSYERIRHLADSLKLIGIEVPGDTDVARFLNACQFCFSKVPSLWEKVSALPTMQQFLGDFYNYDAILAKANEQDGEV